MSETQDKIQCGGVSNGHSDTDTDHHLANGKSKWSEHVWSTFIHRGYSDDVTEKSKVVQGKELLTEFQQDKFRYFFYHVLDLNSDHVISKEDFIKLNKRIKHYMDWSVNTIQFLALQVLTQNYYFCKTININNNKCS